MGHDNHVAKYLLYKYKLSFYTYRFEYISLHGFVSFSFAFDLFSLVISSFNILFTLKFIFRSPRYENNC